MEKLNRLMNDNQTYDEFNTDIDKKLKEKDFLGALKICDEARKIFPEKFDFKFMSGICHKSLDDDEKAKKFLLESIELEPRFLPAYDIITDILTNQAETIDINYSYIAIELLDKALEIQPDNKEIIYKMALMNLNLANYSDAIKDFEALNKLDPQDALYITKLAQAYSRSGNAEKSIELINDYHKDNPERLELISQLAVAKHSKEEFKEAREIYNKLLQSPELDDANEFRFAVVNNYCESLRMETDKKYHEEYLSLVEENLLYFPSSNVLQKAFLTANILCENKEVFKKEDIFLNNMFPLDREVASLNLYLSNRYDEVETSDFCPNAFDCVINYNLSDYSEKHDELIEKAIISIKNQKLVFDQPFKTDINAHRTEYDLCKLGDKAINDIISLVEAASNDYEKEIKLKNEGLFAKNWPKKTNIKSWSMIANKESFHVKHNHCEAWYSGVLYLKMPNNLSNDDGSIVFTSSGYNFPISNKDKEIIINPKEGDIVFFPSHLYHYTKPFKDNGERICLPFNICPVDI